MRKKTRQGLIFALFAVLFSGWIHSVRSNQETAWQPISLTPVQKFARISQPQDLDEGQYTKYDSFLSAHYNPNQDTGRPGVDAPGQPYRRHPYALTLSSDESKLYVTFEGNEAEPASSVGIIDTATRTLRGEIQVGRRP